VPALLAQKRGAAGRRYPKARQAGRSGALHRWFSGNFGAGDVAFGLF
jgi:hypothetical protein